MVGLNLLNMQLSVLVHHTQSCCKCRTGEVRDCDCSAHLERGKGCPWKKSVITAN